MKNNYLILSDDKIVIDLKIKKILEEHKKSNVELIKLEMEETPVSRLLEEINTYNFLSECKVIICYNCSFLEKDVFKEVKDLKEYFLNPQDNILILIASKISDKKEIKDLFSENVEIIDSGISSEVLIKNNLQGFHMENKNVKYLVEYCFKNNERILNELEKLKLYKMDDSNKIITQEDINKIVIKQYDEDVFTLVNAIARRDKANSFAIYKRLIERERDCTGLLASIASQIRLLYSVKTLSEKRMNIEKMAKIINVKTRAVSIALENSQNFSTKKLIFLLNKIADIDWKIKSGQTSSGNNLFEIFLLNI